MVIGKPQLGRRVKITIMEYECKQYIKGAGMTIYGYTLEKAIENIIKGFTKDPKGPYDFATDKIKSKVGQ